MSDRIRVPVRLVRVVVVVVETCFGGGAVVVPYLHHCLQLPQPPAG